MKSNTRVKRNPSDGSRLAFRLAGAAHEDLPEGMEEGAPEEADEDPMEEGSETPDAEIAEEGDETDDKGPLGDMGVGDETDSERGSAAGDFFEKVAKSKRPGKTSK